jgi:hypothetical protein
MTTKPFDKFSGYFRSCCHLQKGLGTTIVVINDTGNTRDFEVDGEGAYSRECDC